MTAGACGTTMPSQTDVVLGVFPFFITATGSKKEGYSHSFCYSCIIKPAGLPLITFNKDFIEIT